MANTLLTPTQVTREAARLLVNNLGFTKGVNRTYDDKFMLGGAKTGDAISMRLPSRYVGRTGATLATEDQVETSRTLTLDTQFGVDVTFTTKELTMQIQDFSERVLAPAIATIANKIDFDGLALANYRTANAVGTRGTTPATMLLAANAGAYISQEGGARDDLRTLCLEPIAMAGYFDAFKGLFQSSNEIAEQYRSGIVGRSAGFKWVEDANVFVHTVGVATGTPLVNGASQGILTGWAEYTDLATDGWTNSTTAILRRGDIITLAGVNATNPQNRQDLGRLRQFVVESTTGGNVDSGASTGPATCRIRPAIIAGGQFQNCTARPADNAAITVLGTGGQVSPSNIAYHRDAFVLGMADLEMPEGVHWAARVSDPQTGISIRAVRQYTISNDSIPCRLDVLYGWASLLPELSCKIVG